MSSTSPSRLNRKLPSDFFKESKGNIIAGIKHKEIYIYHLATLVVLYQDAFASFVFLVRNFIIKKTMPYVAITNNTTIPVCYRSQHSFIPWRLEILTSLIRPDVLSSPAANSDPDL